MYRLTVIVVALLVIVALAAAAPTPAPAAGGPPVPTLPATQGPKRTPGPAPTLPVVEQAALSAEWLDRDLLVTWTGDGTELVLLHQGTDTRLAYAPGEYRVKGGGVNVNAAPMPGDVLIVHGRSGQLLAYLELGAYPLTPRAVLPVVVR